MEKCTYCIQRTNEAKIELKIKGIRNNDQGVPDGYVQTACQQACPSNAIVFGDIRDTDSVYKLDDGTTRAGSLVHQMREHERTYALLGYLAVKPRTTYMVRVNNPNPSIRKHDETPFGHHGTGPGYGGHEGEHGGHEGHDHGKGQPAGKAHSLLNGRDGERHFIDPHRAGTEGYVMSLSVLGTSSGARA
jgi:molybdopterin-containing oxidoreductase family iron-sulfur binding subunit